MLEWIKEGRVHQIEGIANAKPPTVACPARVWLRFIEQRSESDMRSEREEMGLHGNLEALEDSPLPQVTWGAF